MNVTRKFFFGKTSKGSLIINLMLILTIIGLLLVIVFQALDLGHYMTK